MCEPTFTGAEVALITIAALCWVVVMVRVIWAIQHRNAP